VSIVNTAPFPNYAKLIAHVTLQINSRTAMPASIVNGYQLAVYADYAIKEASWTLLPLTSAKLKNTPDPFFPPLESPTFLNLPLKWPILSPVTSNHINLVSDWYYSLYETIPFYF